MKNEQRADGGQTWSRREMLRVLPVGAAAVAAGGCGYALAGRGTFLPDYIRAIAVPIFENRTPYATVEQLFTEKVRVEFQGRGQYTVVMNEAEADAVVRGDITGISASPVGFSDLQIATRYRFSISVRVRLDDLRQKRTLWENAGLTFADEYELGSRTGGGVTVATFIDQERGVMDRLSTDFARSVVSAILEAF